MHGLLKFAEGHELNILRVIGKIEPKPSHPFRASDYNCTRAIFCTNIHCYYGVFIVLTNK